jgi:hypothetical protein
MRLLVERRSDLGDELIVRIRLLDECDSSFALRREHTLAHLSWGDKCLRAGEFCKVGVKSRSHAVCEALRARPPPRQPRVS